MGSGNNKLLLAVFFLFFASFAHAQSNKLKKADSNFESFAYPQAVRGYEDLLMTGKLETEQRQTVLTNLALSYKKLQDYRNAERIYSTLFKEFEENLSSEQYLLYAQVLAGNAKYRESQKMFSKYGEYQKDDLRSGRFALAYMDESKFHKDSALYKIEYLDKINGRFSDFSPMFYENGLVFVAARKEGTIIKRIFNQNETPFLDLFLFPDSTLTFIPDSSEIGEDAMAELGTSFTGFRGIDTTEHEGIENVIPNPELEIEEFSKKINSKYHEGPVTFTRDFRKVIFTRNNYYKGKTKKSNKGINMLKLYIADKQGKKWTNIKELPFNSNEFSTGHPAFSPENNRLYFSSDMPGGFGGVDLYVVDYNNGEWGNPINLGREVNTEGDEMFPFVDQYGNLYFASNGHAGLGGLDIFYMEMRSGIPFGEAENLGSPINSSKDDFGLITDGRREKGYFSSNRKRGYADDNIYSFIRGCNRLDIKVFDKEKMEPIAQAEVRLIKNEVNRDQFETNDEGVATVCLEAGSDFYFKIFKNGYAVSTVTYGTLSSSLTKNQSITVYLEKTTIPLVRGRVVSEFDHSPIVSAQVTLENQNDGSVETVITGLDGRYTFQPVKEGKYLVKAVKENSIAISKNVDLKEDEKSDEAEVSMLAVGDMMELQNIYYNYGKFEVNTAGKKELNEKVIPLLKQYPDIKIELRSHTDSQSSSDFNLKLSQKRADAVKKYLLGSGISESRVLARGYGETELLNECDDTANCTASQHKVNRRTEIKIISLPELSAR